MEKKPRRKHSAETIKKMSEKRRARTVQPRSGTSKKAYNLYLQLKKDYKGHYDESEIMKWIEENKHILNSTADETKDMGIHCDYHSQYPGIYEVKVAAVLYGDKVDDDLNCESDPYDLIDDDIEGTAEENDYE